MTHEQRVEQSRRCRKEPEPTVFDPDRFWSRVLTSTPIIDVHLPFEERMERAWRHMKAKRFTPDEHERLREPLEAVTRDARCGQSDDGRGFEVSCPGLEGPAQNKKAIQASRVIPRTACGDDDFRLRPIKPSVPHHVFVRQLIAGVPWHACVSLRVVASHTGLDACHRLPRRATYCNMCVVSQLACSL